MAESPSTADGTKEHKINRLRGERSLPSLPPAPLSTLTLRPARHAEGVAIKGGRATAKSRKGGVERGLVGGLEGGGEAKERRGRTVAPKE